MEWQAVFLGCLTEVGENHFVVKLGATGKFFLRKRNTDSWIAPATMMGACLIPQRGKKNSMNQFSDQWFIGTTATAGPLDRKHCKKSVFTKTICNKVFRHNAPKKHKFEIRPKLVCRG